MNSVSVVSSVVGKSESNPSCQPQVRTLQSAIVSVQSQLVASGPRYAPSFLIEMSSGWLNDETSAQTPSGSRRT